MKHIFRLLLIVLAATACKEVYDTPPQSLAQINLYDIDTESSKSTLTSVKGANMDSIWIDGETASYFQLPFDQSGMATFIVLLDSVADTLIISYNSGLAYESMESGFYTEHDIQWVSSTRNKIDSISLIDTLVTTIWHENIQLYLNDSTAYSSSN
ncbi:DUF6452 family protein [Mangrovibacterium sp.]|uniref:DUF6452 family protein n=1 Tax=Mangrovibacterium sp. TaxID=1961364 RepID=UPI0035675CAB